LRGAVDATPSNHLVLAKPARRRRPGVRKNTAAGGGKGLKLACSQPRTGDARGQTGVEQADLPGARASVSFASPKLGSGANKRGEGRAEVSHNWVRGTRIGEATNPGPVQGWGCGTRELPRHTQTERCRFGGGCKYPYCPFGHPREWTAKQRQPQAKDRKEGSNLTIQEVKGWGGRGRPPGGVGTEAPRKQCRYGIKCWWRGLYCPFEHPRTAVQGIHREPHQEWQRNKEKGKKGHGRESSAGRIFGVDLWGNASLGRAWCSEPAPHSALRPTFAHRPQTGSSTTPWQQHNSAQWLKGSNLKAKGGKGKQGMQQQKGGKSGEKGKQSKEADLTHRNFWEPLQKGGQRRMLAPSLNQGSCSAPGGENGRKKGQGRNTAPGQKGVCLSAHGGAGYLAVWAEV
jgi:hypothetical protein